MNTNLYYEELFDLKKKVWLLRPLPHGTDHLESFLQNGFITEAIQSDKLLKIVAIMIFVNF